MKLGIFGGSFDPVHRGHLVLAECCLQQATLDAIWFVPAAHQPFKPTGPVANAADRLAMLQLALADSEPFDICQLEIDRGGLSYTIDTMERIHYDHPDDELFLLMGADLLGDFPYWRRPTELCTLATPIVVNRAGEPAPNFEHLQDFVSPEHLQQIIASQVHMPPKPISSTTIRALVAERGDWQAMVPPAVARYIDQHALYRQP